MKNVDKNIVVNFAVVMPQPMQDQDRLRTRLTMSLHLEV